MRYEDIRSIDDVIEYFKGEKERQVHLTKISLTDTRTPGDHKNTAYVERTVSISTLSASVAPLKVD